MLLREDPSELDMKKIARHAKLQQFLGWYRLYISAFISKRMALFSLAVCAISAPYFANVMLTQFSEEDYLSSSPQYQSLVQEIEDAEDTTESLEAVKAKLVRQGMVRLEDNDLLQFFSIWDSMLSKIDDNTCAAFARGAVTAVNINTGLGTLNRSQIQTWFHIQVKAALATLENKPVPPLLGEEIKNAQASLLAHLEASERTRYMSLFQQRSLSTAEYCWQGRITSKTLLQLERIQEQATLVRVLFMNPLPQAG